jgi:dodecin
MAVATVTEITATSTQSFEDAIRQGLERTTKTLRNVTAAYVKEQRVRLENDKIKDYLVHLEVTFVLEG